MKTAKELKNELFYTKESVYALTSDDNVKAAYDYSVNYKKYLDSAKTEREAVNTSIEIAEKAGFKPYTLGQALKAGDKLYYNNRGKSLFLFTIGSEDIENGIRISAAHIDSPRLDFKPCPLYEDSRMAFFKTHYYGGIKKYQWVTIPLAIHGVVTLKDGTNVNITIGEDEGDPIFYINDILPHLGQNQAKKTLGEAIEGEQLNLLAATSPYNTEDEGEQIKLNVLALLNEKYGITETDFISAELSAVPAGKARDIGLDRAAIISYGHDDKVCAYPALTSVIDNADSKIIAFAPYAAEFELDAGTHKLNIDAYINRTNGFGPLHDADEKTPYQSPGIWRSHGDKWSYEYRLHREGILVSPLFSELK